jgi:hypothetical protein
MIRFLTSEVQNSDNFIHVYQCDSDNELANAISQVMIGRGYKLKEGTIVNGVYEKGDRTMRLLFGAFVKYFKFTINVTNMKVTLNSGTSGFSGGVIGIGQVRKEAGEIAEVFKTLQ